MIRRAGGAGVYEISGRWIAEWIEVGLDDIAEYLASTPHSRSGAGDTGAGDLRPRNPLEDCGVRLRVGLPRANR